MTDGAGHPHDEPTLGQNLYDVAFGVVLPPLCLAVDASFLRRHSLFGSFASMAYAFVASEAGLALLWMILRRRLAGSSMFFAGPFLTGGLCAFLIGMAILPMALMTLLAGVGFLGLVPFFTCVTFYRNGVRAIRRSRPHVRNPWLVATVAVGMFLPVWAAALLAASS